MAENFIATDLIRLLDQSYLAWEGADLQGAAIDLRNNTAPVIWADREALKQARDLQLVRVVAANEADGEFRAAKSQAQALIRKSAGVLRPYLGGPGEAWTETGLDVAAPSRRYAVNEIVPTLEGLGRFFGAHPEREAPDAEPPVTVASLAAAAALFRAERQARNQAWSQCKAATNATGAAKSALQERLRHLINELKQKLGKRNPLWLAFGLAEPGALQTPGRVGAVEAERLEDEVVILKWKPASRAGWYHIFRAQGAGAAQRLEGQFYNSPTRLSGQPPDARFCVEAVNPTGHGPPSDFVSV